MRSLILRTIAPIVLHLTLLLSLFLLLYGHNQPGGGFIAGLMTAVGLILQWVAFDGREGWSRFHWPWDKIFPASLALAIFTGVFGLLFGAFLKSSIYEFELPFIGTIEVLTAFLFDLGVYGVVVGVVMSILTNFCDRRVMNR
ncbi:MAG: MnhB domain-containing protein [bacterium]